jgi:transcriptional regulator GlxA family with amidase domain
MNAPETLLCLTFPGFQLLDLTGPYAMFAAANRLAGATLYTLKTAAPQAGPVESSSGLPVIADCSAGAACALVSPAVTVLAAGGEEEGLRAALKDPGLAAVVDAGFERAGRVASVCSGAFLLAASGRLSGRRVTTHWRSAALLQRLFPDIAVEPDAIHIRDGKVWTSAGVTAGIDLALAMIEADHGRDLALAVARENVVYRIRSGGQAQFSSDLAAQAVDDRRLARLAEAIRMQPERDWSVAAMCDELAVSPRTLSRLCRSEMATSPAAFVERVRIDSARALLVETRGRIDAIARAAGFGTHQRMDRAFMRQLGISPSGYRTRFRSPLPEEARA